jgi:putative membrane protein
MRKTVFLFSLSLLAGFATMAQANSSAGSKLETGTIGKMKVAAFNSLNAKGAAMVTAIKPTKAALSTADNDLLMQVAMGGQKQLAVSQAALSKVTNPQVKLLAQSEVDEQTNIAAKLKEVATAKGVTLPAETNAAADSLLTQMNSLSGAELDAFYVAQSGIKGHQELLATMTTVNKTAKDVVLKALATATLPVIRLHLKVSTDVHTSQNASGNSSAK